MRQVYCWAAVLYLFCSISYAGRQNPIFLIELNDFENEFIPGRVHVSSDEDNLFFARSTPSKTDALWEARRNPETGIYDQQRQLSELKNGGAQVYGVWMSEDKLRLYYAVSDPQTLGWSRRPIWMATRSSPDAPWQTVKRHSELEIEPFQTNCTLSADEKVIMWETATFDIGGLKRIFTATRSSIQHNFSNIREAYELEAIQAWTPYMTKDGLTVFFRIQISGGAWEPWMGRRESLDQPFGSFELIEGLYGVGISVVPCLSGDRQRVYYFHRPSIGADITNTGIYVSEWVELPYVAVIRNLLEAIADKEQAVMLIQSASDKEEVAMRFLSELSKDEIPAGVSGKDIQQAIRLIRMALQKQQLVQQILEMNLEYLDGTRALLSPPGQEP
ncbi:MAG: hypothetical protein GXY41_11500 [Phycisphaerae bacterium]|nr:hypothetical protein [Phycisphaerae bacterium]